MKTLLPLEVELRPGVWLGHRTFPCVALAVTFPADDIRCLAPPR